MSKLSEWSYKLKRFQGFVRTLFKSKMAITGAILLIGFSVVAAAAPVITPYDPQATVVAGSFGPPSWMRYFSEGSRLSENLELESGVGFPDQASLNGWRLDSQSSLFTATFDSSVSRTPGSGSVKITMDRTTPVSGSFTVTFKKIFTYPYSGPPAKFDALIALSTPTASSTEPVEATVFIERLPQVEVLPPWYITAPTSWAEWPFSTPSQPGNWRGTTVLDSSSLAVGGIRDILNAQIDPAELIFSSADQFSYGVSIRFTSNSPSTQPLVVYLDDMNIRLFGTSWGLMGTEAQGLDVFTQVVHGARISLLVGLLAAFIGIAVGLVIGLIAGYMGKFVDEVLMRFTDMLLVIPGLPLLIVLIAVLGNRLGPNRLPILIIVIGFLGWMGFARVVRSQVLTLRERPFVEAAKAAGAGTGHIASRHIVPNIIGLIYVNLALAVPGAILAEAALSFLGLGDTTVMSWGRMLSEVQLNGAQDKWWWVIPPGLSIALVSLSFVLIGYSLDEIFNPKLRRRK